VNSQVTARGTITLTAAAPTGGATISLDSSDRDVARPPSTVTVPAGSNTVSFNIETSTIREAVTITIFSSYAGVNRNATLRVQPPQLVPQFSVTSPSKGDNACEITNANGDVDCRADASASQGFPSQFLWTFRAVTGKEITKNTSTAETIAETDCGMLKGATEKNDGTTIDFFISLQLRGRDGTLSSVVTKSVTLTHNGHCDYDD
jgi:hypothetical protein